MENLENQMIELFQIYTDHYKLCSKRRWIDLIKHLHEITLYHNCLTMIVSRCPYSLVL